MPRREPHYDYRTLTVLRGVKAGKSQAAICASLPINHSNAVRRFHVLARRGFISRKAKGKPQFWELTAEGKAVLSVLHRVYDTAPLEGEVSLSWHCIQILFPYKKKPPAFERRLLKGGFVAVQRATYGGFEAKMSGCIVLASPVSVWVMFKEPGATVKRAVRAGLKRALGVKTMLENKFPGLKLNADGLLTRQHLAVRGGFSLQVPEGYKYRSDRLMIDASQKDEKGNPVIEFEGIHSKLAHEDMARVMAFWEALIRGEVSLDALKLVSLSAGKPEPPKELTGYG